MTDTLSNFEENCKPIFHFSPRTLVELSSFKVAMNIWLQKFKEFYPPQNTSYIDLFEMDVNSENLSRIPHKIRKIIDAWFYPLTKKYFHWISYSKDVSGNFSYHRFYTRFDLVVFGSDCRVHFKNTVMNFLEDDSLDNVTKFEMACVYCVEEKIDSLWPLVSYTLSIDYLLFDNNFMLYYWICRKKDQLNRIPLQGFGRIELLMIDLCCSDRNWSAIQYFLSLLDPNDRIQQINQFFESGRSFEFITHLLPFLEAPLQHQVVNIYFTNIFAAFVAQGDSFHHVIQVWLHIKDRLSGEQFYRDIIKRIICQFDSYNYCNEIGSSIKNTYVESILMEIWHSSPENLKQFILNFHFQDVLNELAYHKKDLMKNFGRDISFLLDILSDADIDSRKKFWDENWSKWIAGVPTAQLDRLMALCLAESETIDGFKKQLKDSDVFTNYCNTLINVQCSSELNEFLCYLYPDQEVGNIKVKLLNNNESWKNRIFNSDLFEDIQKYGEFVDNLFSDDNLAQNFKNQFIFAEENFQQLCEVLAAKIFLDVKYIVENFASSDKRVELKEILLNMFRDNLMNGGLYGFHEIDADCGIFLTWCVDDEDQRMKCFMKSLPIDEIFEAALSNCLKFNPHMDYECDRFKKSCRFEDLNKFLAWYFESTELCENFLRRKIEYYGEMSEGDVESIFNKGKEFVVERMKKEWICDGRK